MPTMSALGQKRTCAVQNVMSALPPKADMCGATRHVRFVPIADIGLRSLYYLGGIVLFSPRLLTLSEQPPPS